MKFRNILSIVCSTSAIFSVTNAYGLFRIIGNVGYESMQPEKVNNVKPEKLTGFGAGALAQLDISIVPTLGLVVGGGPQYYSVGYSKSGVDLNVSELMLDVEAGACLSIPMIMAQVVGGYGFGINSKAKATIDIAGLKTTSESDLKDSSRIHVAGRAIFTVAPLIGIGPEVAYLQGSFKDKTSSIKTDYSGYAAKLVLSVGW